LTTILFVRHAAHSMPQLLVGRRNGVTLSAEGCAQARRLAEILAREPLAAVQASPRERAQATAAAIAAPHILPVETAPALDEIDVGLWTGLPFAELDKDPAWRVWNSARATARPPHGESMKSLQDRVLVHLEEVKKIYRRETVVLVSHAEPIRAALLHARGLSLNDWMCVDVPIAGISKLDFHRGPVRTQSLAEALPA
jgi:broad specificity phosphatase PhoE